MEFASRPYDKGREAKMIGNPVGRLTGLIVLLTALCNAGGAQAASGFVALEGSDATAFHQDPQYTPQLFAFLAGPSSLPVLVYNPAGTIPINNPGTATLVYSTTLPAVLTGVYSAIYIESPGGCCAADNTVLNGFGAEVSSFITSGG